MNISRSYIFLVLLLLSSMDTFAQQEKDKAVHILFLLDGSGSMKDEWKGHAKFDIAKNILFHLTDSLERRNENIQFGLRVFGHQFPFKEKVCDDSKLEVPFSKENAESFRETLTKIEAQGWTPIAYTLKEALYDFKDAENLNYVILITDGDESCEGDPCEAAGAFHKMNIALKPYIVGLGLEGSLEEKFNCVGNYHNVSDSSELSLALKSIIQTSLKETTTEIRVHTPDGRKISELPITFKDHYSEEYQYHFIHAERPDSHEDSADTLRLNPKLSYDITLHSTPPMYIYEKVLEPGLHNIIDFTLEEGRLHLKANNMQTVSETQALIRSADGQELVKVLKTGENIRIMAGSYYVELLTLPITILPEVLIEDDRQTNIKIPIQGTLRIEPNGGNHIISLYEVKEEGPYERIYEIKSIKSKRSMKILPGEYYAVWRSNDLKMSDMTRTKYFTIRENGISTLKL